MTSSHRKAIIWPVGLVVLAAGGLSTLGLLAFATPTSPIVIALIVVNIASLAGLVALRMTRTPDTGSVPVEISSDSLHGNEERLRLLESAVIHAHDAVVVMEAEPREGAGRSVLYARTTAAEALLEAAST